MSPYSMLAVVLSIPVVQGTSLMSIFSLRKEDYSNANLEKPKEFKHRVMAHHIMDDKGLNGMGAVCLDGSDAGFHFAAAPSGNDWHIDLEGGGWCYNEADCLERATALPKYLGSTKVRPCEAVMFTHGIMSDDCDVNPDFCNFNRVRIGYCDGTSFSGNREDPITVNGEKIYFRGRRILDATLETLMGMGLDQAESVVLTGFDAGGLALLMQTDYIHAYLKEKVPTLKKFKAVPISGFYLTHDTGDGRPLFPESMQSIFELSNATGSGDASCLAAKSEASKWTCGMADVAYQYVDSPIFLINSALDQWQTQCIVTNEAPALEQMPVTNVFLGGLEYCTASEDWAECIREIDNCTDKQTGELNEYIGDFNEAVFQTGAATSGKKGNGAFIHSCHTHVDPYEDAKFTGLEINGVSMQAALSSWWESGGDARKHSYEPCLLNADGKPRQCNSRCKVAEEVPSLGDLIDLNQSPCTVVSTRKKGRVEKLQSIDSGTLMITALGALAIIRITFWWQDSD